MAQSEKNASDSGEGMKELPEAFTINAGSTSSQVESGRDKVTPTSAEFTVVEERTPATPGEIETSTGLNVVEEGSEESFPASDTPSTMPPTSL